MDNARYKAIQSVDQLEKILRENPNCFIYDRWPMRESRYFFGKSRDSFELSVDGRSVRAIYYKLSRHSEDGGRQLEIE